MAVDALTLTVICVLILLGFYIKMLWLSFIFIVVLLLYLAVGVKKTPRPVAVPTAAGPRVQPIIIRRKYVGPESIYPKKMNIYVDETGTPTDWREYGPQGVGKAVGSGIKKVFGLFK